mgnify:CR=1 FL=1
MSHAGVAGARALVATTLSLVDDLTPEQWAADAACHGWRVQDVVTHLGFFFNFIADPGLVLPDNPSGTSERLNDAGVRERAAWAPEQAAAYYREQSVAGLAAIEALQGDDLRDQPLPMLDLGTYRMAQLADAVAFDHLVHLSSDVLAPYGPVPAIELPVVAALDPAIDWMLAGLPQMCGTALRPALTRPVGLRLTGATERSFVIAAEGDRVVVHESDDLPADVATSDATDFLRWGTTRTAWRSAVTVAGDRAHVAAVLDRVDVV